MYTLVVRTSRISDPGVGFTYVVVTSISDFISLFIYLRIRLILTTSSRGVHKCVTHAGCLSPALRMSMVAKRHQRRVEYACLLACLHICLLACLLACLLLLVFARGVVGGCKLT